nr:hypothetical protein [Tanacetum cinerariifolium]
PELDEVTNLQCDYLELLHKCECLETELSKSKQMSKSFESVQKHAINLELELQQCKKKTLPANKKSCLKNTHVLALGMYKNHTAHTQARTSKLPQDSKKTNKSVSFSTGVIPSTSVSRPQLKSNPKGDRVVRSNSHGKKLKVEEHRRNVKKTVASESNKKPRNNVRKLYERVSKTCSWWYSKFTPSGYIWKPKSGTGNVNLNVSMPLGNASRTANVKDTMTSRR